jgi:TolB-like protein
VNADGSLVPAASFRVADWVVDPKACRLIRGADEIPVRPLLVDLLALLASRPGEVVTKDEILERVWQGRFLCDSVLTRTMTELRHVLQDSAVKPAIIETIRKRGYRLIAAVSGLLPAPRARLAVLPFENLNRDAELDFFAAGVADALTTELGNIASLQVISRQSVLAVARSGTALPEIARRLRVDAVLEGSALQAGERVRITAQLVRTEPERHVWAQSYVADMKDILELQGRVARAVAEAVEAALTPSEVARLSRPRPIHPEAQLAYLKARYHAARWDREGLEKGLAFAQKALQIDPSCAPAYVLVGYGLTVLGYWCHLPVEVAYPRAREAASRAIQLDGSLGEAHAILGLMQWLMHWDFDGCDKEMRTALDLNPSSEIVHGFYALFLAVSRDAPEEAERHAQQMLDLDPLSMSTNFFVGWLRFFCGNFEGAIEQARHTLAMYPDCLHANYVLGWAALGLGRPVDAVAAFRDATALERHVVSVAYLATALGRAGERDEARELLAELMARAGSDHVPAFLLALVHGGLGETDTALGLLTRCYEVRDSRTFWFRRAPIGSPLLADGRFRDLLRRVDEAARSYQPLAAPDEA